MRSLIVYFYIAFLVGLSAGVLSGCACLPGKGDGATCARQTLIAVDAVNAAGTRQARKWVGSCQSEARALDAAGKVDEADKKYGECRASGEIVLRVSMAADDGVEAAADGVDAGEKIGLKDYSAALAPAIGAAKAFVKGLANQGIKIPAYLTAFLGVQ